MDVKKIRLNIVDILQIGKKQLIIICFLLNLFEVYPQTPQNFFFNDWHSKIIDLPLNYLSIKPPQENSNIQVNINFKDTLAKVSPYLLGHNVNTFFGVYYNNAELLKNIKNLDCKVLRYPGGSGSNIFFWDRSKADGIPEDANTEKAKYGVSDDSNYLSLTNFYRLRDSLNVTSVFVVNYSYARYGTGVNPVAKAAHYAADWVRYDNGRTKFWEIGNENYGSWEEGYEIDTTQNQDGQPQFQTGELYGKHFRVFVDSMRAAAAELGSKIKIGAVGYKRPGSWNNQVMKEVGDIADFIIVHKYFAHRGDDARDYILQTAFEAAEPKQAVTDALTNNGFTPLPVALTEWNISPYGSLQKVSVVNGMHAVLTLGELIKAGYGFSTRWNLVWRYKDGNTHGLIAADRDNDIEGVEPFQPRAPFFYFYYFQKYFGDVLLNSSVIGSKLFSVYASSFANGPAGIVLINRSSDDKIVKINAENYSFGERYFWYVLTGGNDNGNFSRQVLVNGNTTDNVAGGPKNYFDIKPYSAEILDSVKISVPAYSTIFVLLDGRQYTSVKESSQKTLPENFRILQNYPNPFNPSTTIVYYINKPSFIKLEIYNTLGKIVTTLVSGKQNTGKHQISWNGKNSTGSLLASGIYFARLTVGTISKDIKLLFLK